MRTRTITLLSAWLTVSHLVRAEATYTCVLVVGQPDDMLVDTSLTTEETTLLQLFVTDGQQSLTRLKLANALAILLKLFPLVSNPSVKPCTAYSSTPLICTHRRFTMHSSNLPNCVRSSWPANRTYLQDATLITKRSLTCYLPSTRKWNGCLFSRNRLEWRTCRRYM